MEKKARLIASALLTAFCIWLLHPYFLSVAQGRTQNFSLGQGFGTGLFALGLWPIAVIGFIAIWLAFGVIYRGKAPDYYGYTIGYKRPW